jgi:hypothetical protein
MLGSLLFLPLFLESTFYFLFVFKLYFETDWLFNPNNYAMPIALKSVSNHNFVTPRHGK